MLLTDRNGHVDERYEYDIWGKAYDGKFADGFPGCGQKGNVYGFTGQRYQAELGIYSFPYRDYSPRTMRWLTEDPVKDGANWYVYCGNNPVNLVDPFGLSTGEAIIQWGESVSGYGTIGKAIGGLAIVIGTIVLYNETQKSKENDTTKDKTDKRHTPEQEEVVAKAKQAKKTGLTQEEAEEMVEQAKEVGLPARGPETHPNRKGDTSKEPHIHVDTVDHIPVKGGCSGS